MMIVMLMIIDHDDDVDTSGLIHHCGPSQYALLMARDTHWVTISVINFIISVIISIFIVISILDIEMMMMMMMQR